MFDWHGLQRPAFEDIDDWILEQYREMYEAFFEDRLLIPNGRLHEVSYEKLEKDALGELRKLYAAMDLPEFDIFEPALKGYLSSLAGYQKNRFEDLSAEVRAKVYRAWKFCFDEWGYSHSIGAAAEALSGVRHP